MSKELYSQIEDLIIRWSNDGTKTAGSLTRQIMETLSQQKHKYVIVDLRNMDYMKNEKGEINYYETLDEACTVCGMYEFEDAWVCKLEYNHIEDKH
jgi:predicted Zn-ribbon and HTH transcriptional regulator